MTMKYAIINVTNATEKKACSMKERASDGRRIHPPRMAQV